MTEDFEWNPEHPTDYFWWLLGKFLKALVDLCLRMGRWAGF
jgi:hypothetical protein